MLESVNLLSVYGKNSWERCLENDQMVINSDWFSHSKLVGINDKIQIVYP